MRRTIWLLPALLLGVLAGCGHKPSAEAGDGKPDPPAPAVQVVPVARQTLTRTLPATGTLVALRDHEVTVTPPVAGLLDSLPVRYGEAVQKGQVIAHLSTRQLQGQIQQAQATIRLNLVQVQQAQANASQQRAQTRTNILQAKSALNGAQATLVGARATLVGDEAAQQSAQQTLTRQQTLLAEGLVAQKDVEAAQLAVRTAQAQADVQRQVIAAQAATVAGLVQALAAARAASVQDLVKLKDVQVSRQQVQNARGALATAQAQAALYTIRAPLSGQITQIGATQGETVDTTAKLAVIADLRSLQLQIAVPTSAARQVRPGMAVTFTVPGVPGAAFRTTVQSVSPQVDAATGTVAVLAVVANPRRLLRDDTTAQVEIVAERRPDVLVVPQSAILTDPDSGKTTVVVVGTDSVAHVTPVKTGLSAGGKVQIVGGLTAGQKVAVAGQYGLPDATKVSVQGADAGDAGATPKATDAQGAGAAGVQTPADNAPGTPPPSAPTSSPAAPSAPSPSATAAPSPGGSPGGDSPGGNSPGGNSPGGNSPGGNSPGGGVPSSSSGSTGGGANGH